MFDLGELRLKEMDEAGVDIQVLSHGAPSTQMAHRRRCAVELGRARQRPPGRVREAGSPTASPRFAALPTADPAGAADELRALRRKLGFKGAMIHGTANGMFLDDKRFWPIFERAEKLDVPIYLHPSIPLQAVMDAYYKDYIKDFPMVIRAAWGFTVETATQAIRMVLSRRVRQASEPEDHPRPPGRDAAVPALAHRPVALAPRHEPAVELPRHVLASTSSSPPAATSPIRRCCAACRRWASTASCSRSTGRSWPTRSAREWIPTHPAVRGGQDQAAERQHQADPEDVGGGCRGRRAPAIS